MVIIENALHGNVVLKITDARGLVVFAETVKAEQVDEIISTLLPRIR